MKKGKRPKYCEVCGKCIFIAHNLHIFEQHGIRNCDSLGRRRRM